MKDERKTITYQTIVDRDCEHYIDELLAGLPEYCRAFNLNRQDRTQIRTRLETLRDIRTFFAFLVANNPALAKIEPKDIPVRVLEQLSVADFDDFTAWLDRYTLKDENGDTVTRTNTKASIKRKLSSVRTLYSFLYDREYISSNPCLKKKMPKIPKKDATTTKILERQQREPFFHEVESAYAAALERIETEKEEKGKASPPTLLLPAIAMRNRAMIYLLLATGIRLSELCAMDCTDYSRELGTINIIRKGGKRDSVYLSETAVEALDAYLDDFRMDFAPNNNNDQAMFLSKRHSRITPRAVELVVKDIADRSLGTNNGISPHRLRATFGTEYYNQTHDIKATSVAMGHESMQTTSTYYVRDNESAKEQAREIKF